MAASLLAIAAVLCSCVSSHYSPVTACPVLADGTHPSSGPLEVLPSEVPDVQLDSMRWYVHTGHEGEAFGTWTSVSALGRIVSTKETSLVGVGVLVEGMRDAVVVHRMIDSRFYDARQLPWSSQGYMTITRETVRPDRPVQVGAGEKDLAGSPPPRWGCPTRARIIRLSPPGVLRRARSFGSCRESVTAWRRRRVGTPRRREAANGDEFQRHCLVCAKCLDRIHS